MQVENKIHLLFYKLVKINTGSLDDKDFVNEILAKGEKLVTDTNKLEAEILAIVDSKM